MISLGSHLRGPELEGSPIDRLIMRVMRAVVAARGNQADGQSPAVNVVFYVPGSLGDFDIPKIAAGRFSRKQNLLLVEVPVSRKVAASGGSIEFVFDALHHANVIAAEVFAKMGLQFDLSRARAIVEQARLTITVPEPQDSADSENPDTSSAQ